MTTPVMTEKEIKEHYDERFDTYKFCIDDILKYEEKQIVEMTKEDLTEMMRLFMQHEEYEKCAFIRDWIAEIDEVILYT